MVRTKQPKTERGVKFLAWMDEHYPSIHACAAAAKLHEGTLRRMIYEDHGWSRTTIARLRDIGAPLDLLV